MGPNKLVVYGEEEAWETRLQNLSVLTKKKIKALVVRLPLLRVELDRRYPVPNEIVKVHASSPKYQFYGENFCCVC